MINPPVDSVKTDETGFGGFGAIYPGYFRKIASKVAPPPKTLEYS
jgi:hypothetical protein